MNTGVQLSRVYMIVLFFFSACSVPPPTIEEPNSEDSFLVIGSVVVEDDFYTNNSGVYIKNVEVAILAEIEENGQTLTRGFWTKTDDNGYFYLANVPPGKYALTGVRVFLDTQRWLTISNPLNSSNDNFEINPNDHISFTGNYFDIQPEGRVVNLQNNYFSIDTQSRGYGDVKYIRRNEIRGMRLINGLNLDLIPVEKYFIRQFSGSSWADIIRESR